jgi:hypothetical protein
MLDKVTILDSKDIELQAGDWVEVCLDYDEGFQWYKTKIEAIDLLLFTEHSHRIMAKILSPIELWIDYDDFMENGNIRKIPAPAEYLLLKEACALLHSCLEWDNGGERDYGKIVEFLNKAEK